MTGLRSNIIRASVAALVMMTPWIAGSAAINKKFFKKAADAVWSMDLPQFDPNADLSDSIYQNREVVIIASLVDFTGRYDNTSNLPKRSVTGWSTINAVDATKFTRVMAKFNEPAAIEKFSSMEIPAPESNKYSSVELFRSQSAFGARIYKPDGRVVEVDVNEALPETSGKKNKEQSYKFAIPGLEPGDVLDYFVYTETFADELQIPRDLVLMFSQYPIRSLTVDYKVSPYLAMEYVTLNGAPDFEFAGVNSEGLNHMRIELQDVDAIETTPPYFTIGRQTPYVEVNILNPNARLCFVPKTGRNGGVRKYIFSYLVNDLKSYLNDGTSVPKECVGEVTSLSQQWIKAHPEANERQKADAVWTAASLVADRTKHMFDERMMAIMFLKALHKLKIDIGAQIAATSNRKQQTFSALPSYDRPDIMVVSRGDSCYFPRKSTAFVPNYFDGEEAFTFTASFHPVTGDVTFDNGDLVKLPRTTFKQNSMTCRMTAKVDEANDDMLDLNLTVTASGAAQTNVPSLATRSTVRQAYERFLDAKPSKNNIKLSDEEEIREQLDANAKEVVKLFSDAPESAVYSYNLVSGAMRPDSTDVIIEMDVKASGLVTMAGRNMVVSVGKLGGVWDRVKESHRHREVSIILPSTLRKTVEVVFDIPEGYAVDTESLERLNNNVATTAGLFYSSARLDGNRVIIARQERFSKSIMNATEWPELLKVLDASADFQNATIVLKPL